MDKQCTVQFRSGITLEIEESLFDLGSLNLQENMDIYITAQGNKFTCIKPQNYICHFVGNVTKSKNYFYHNIYKVYVVAIKNDVNLINGSVEIVK